MARRRRRRGLGPGASAVWRRSKCRSRPRIPCRRRRRRGRRGPRRGRRFQVQVPARPRVSAEITVCRVGQPSALETQRASYTTPWATYGSTASSATAASMPCGSGPRHRRRSSKRCMGPRGRPRLSGASATVAGDVGRQSEDSRRPPPAPGLCCSKTAAFESMKDEPNRRPRMRSSSVAVERTSAGCAVIDGLRGRRRPPQIAAKSL